jgi:hypothetical protein
VIPELVACFDRTLAYMRDQVVDLSDEEMVYQPMGFPNHAAWTLGHILYSCQAIAGEMGIEAWLPGDWESQFGYGSSPAHVRSDYASKAGLMTRLSDAGDRLRTVLLSADPNELEKPLTDEDMREVLPTVGHALLQVITAHTAFHAGQLAAWRCAIGRKPIGVFI